jgi:hypothetical protein
MECWGLYPMGIIELKRIMYLKNSINQLVVGSPSTTIAKERPKVNTARIYMRIHSAAVKIKKKLFILWPID